MRDLQRQCHIAGGQQPGHIGPGSNHNGIHADLPAVPGAKFNIAIFGGKPVDGKPIDRVPSLRTDAPKACPA
jgi:hypothetical protein